MLSSQKKKCRSTKTLKLNHLGNTWTKLKYAIHCANYDSLNQTLIILENIGFKVVHRENDTLSHTMLYPPTFIIRYQSEFMIVLSISDKLNDNKIDFKHGRQVSHLGFKVSLKHLNIIRDNLCHIIPILKVDKPDEISLFIQLPCGEVFEFSAWKKNRKLSIKPQL